MGIFDIFTTDAQNAAAGGIRQGLSQGALGYNLAANQGINNLTGYTQAGLGGLGDLFGQGRGAFTGYGGQAADALSGNYGAAFGALQGGIGQGVDALNQNYMAGLQPFQQNYAQSQQGMSALADALGLSGAEGNARATQAFWNNPAIQSQLDIGSENVLRNQNRTGQLSSGATNVDLQNYGQQVASQGWNNYIGQLQPYMGLAQNSAAGIGSMYSGLGNQLAGQYGMLGQGGANIYTGLGNQLAGVYGGLGGGLNQSFMGQGNATNQTYGGLGSQLYGAYNNLGNMMYGNQAGIGNANANADLAGVNASGNIWGMLGGLAGLGAGGAGAGAFKNAGQGIGNFFSGLWSDVRLKDDVKMVGKLLDGQNVYSFRYKGRPETHIGLMAQEVEKTAPDAVIDIAGFKAVDYKRATKHIPDFTSNLMRLAA